MADRLTGDTTGDVFAAPDALIAELATVFALVEGLGPGVVNVGHGRDPISLARARVFLQAWTRRGEQVGAVVSWPDDGDARLGMHQDREELAADPVVSLSLGAACVFRVAGTEHRGRPWKDLELCSGDLVVFGRENRLAVHGVPKLLPDHDVPAIGLERGPRINITLRVSGLGRP